MEFRELSWYAEVLNILSPSFLENIYFLGYGMVAEIFQGVL